MSMKLKFRTPTHPEPIVGTVKRSAAELEAIKPGGLDPKQIVRDMVRSHEPVSDTGNLFFKVNSALAARVFWSHATTLGYAELLEFPNGGKIKDPHKDKVTVYVDEEKVVYDMDAIMWVFMLRNRKTKVRIIPDVLVEDIKDPKLLATELADAVLELCLQTGENLDFGVDDPAKAKK
jgi:hypothetical protein